MNNNVFRGRSLAVVDDFSLNERLYLFEKTRQLKEALKSGDTSTIESFRINNPDFGVYEVFLEDSTRTKESFKNAAEFHRVKLNILDVGQSSFNKHESYADTFNNLAGYNNLIFIVRSKLEGVCRWLEINGKEYAKRNNLKIPPAFINGGDGQHEHPTQELLDEFTFLEDNQWNKDHIHVALVGDLLHGRTVHSKADGLKIFKEVEVDLIAPQELAMPKYYIERMESNGFKVRIFESLEEYFSQDKIAPKYYFTRPQLERMGEDILKRQDELRSYITFRKEFMDKVPEGTNFYHPLPRHKNHPTIPRFLDNTSLNGWEKQSKNGKYIRIILLGLIEGVIGNDFDGELLQKTELVDDFIKEDQPTHSGIKECKEGIRPISKGIVIDHICKGEDEKNIREHIPKVIKVVGLYGRGGEWVDESRTEPGLYKGIIFRPGFKALSEKEIKKLAAVAPDCTLNIIDGEKIVRKLRLKMPPRIYGFKEASCKNENCISCPEHHEGVLSEFHRISNSFVCIYCEKPHTFKELWGN